MRAFPNEDVVHEEGDVDPIRDIQIINGELIAKDIQFVERMLDDLNTRLKRKKEKKDEEELEVIQKVAEGLKNGIFVRDHDWSAKEVEILNSQDTRFVTSKPIVYLVNIGDVQYVKKQNAWLPKIQEFIKNNGGGPMIPYSAEFESQVVDAGKDDKEAQEAKAKELGGVSMIDRIIKAGFKNLSLINFFTAGEDEVRSWTVRDGTKAPGAAGVIHTDFENNFICAETMSFENLIQHGSENEVKAQGLYRQNGKDYVVQDGDIFYFKAGVAQGKKK